MRKHTKQLSAVVAGAAAAVIATGVAFAYWTTSGSGSGLGSTANSDATLTFTQNPAGEPDTSVALAAMYPGDTAQNLVVRVRNTSPKQSAWVPSVKAYITTNKTGCDATDFDLGGVQSAATSEATAEALSWTAVDLAAGAAANATSTIKFHNKSANQDACKGASVTLHYFVPVTPLPTPSSTG